MKVAMRQNGKSVHKPELFTSEMLFFLYSNACFGAQL